MLAIVQRICLALAAICGAVVGAQTAGQLTLPANVVSIISLAGIIAALVAKSVLPSAVPATRTLAMLACLGVALTACSHTSASTVGSSEAACADSHPDVEEAVATALAQEDWQDALNAVVSARGIDLVRCAIAALLDEPPPADATGGDGGARAPAALSRARPVLNPTERARAVVWLASVHR